MTDTSQIVEHMKVVGSDGEHVGTVDRLMDNQIKLTKKDSDEGVHHLIPTQWVDSVKGGELRLSKSAEEAKAAWAESGDRRMDAASGGDRT